MKKEVRVLGVPIYEMRTTESEVSVVETQSTPQPQAAGFLPDNAGWNGYNTIFPVFFDGEKDLGEMGPVKIYNIDHYALRLRSWQAFIDSDVCSALMRRSCDWVIGTGLKLQAMPKKRVLDMLKINMGDTEDFNESVEALFDLFASTQLADFAQKDSLNEIAREAWKNAIAGGDVLLVMHYENGMPKVQLIDGQRVRTPLAFGTTTNMDTINPDNGNIIRHGVELNDRGEHVAYWVAKRNIFVNMADFDRYPVRMDKYPYCQTAKMVYGLKYRLDNVRGIPMITAVMETAVKMSRYREATIAGAEERAKIHLFIKHEKESTGDFPFIQQAAQASGFTPQADLPADSYGRNLSDKVYATTNKQAVNMPIGATLESLESKQELTFAEFYSANFDIVCAVAGYPPEVILSKYNSNYSASRAAIKDFEHTIIVQRQSFSEQFYQTIYNFCLDAWVINNLIDLPGYERALGNKNQIALAAYRYARFPGDVVPHIDPIKEVKAWREKLGADSANIPLCTVADAIEALAPLGGTSFDNTIQQYAKELEKAEALGIEKVAPKGEPSEGSGIATETDNNK